MPLNIRNKQAEELAGALAKLSGETKTEAVTQALRERLGATRIRGARTSSWVTTSTEFPTDGDRYVGGAPHPLRDLDLFIAKAQFELANDAPRSRNR